MDDGTPVSVVEREVAMSAGATPAASLVSLLNVRKSYGKRGRSVEALAPLTLSVGRGESVALVGPNGVGKTTALKIVATLVEPTSGTAIVCGHDVVGDSGRARRAVGVSLGSRRSFYWRLTTRHNLSFFARLRGVRGARIPAEIDQVAREMGLGPNLDLPVRRLSRGALARLSVGRAMLGDPTVLLLDEPLASVDRAGRELVWRAIERRLAAGACLLLATHEPEVASRCGSAVSLGGAPRVPGRAAR